MGSIFRREDSKGRATYMARVRRAGYPNLTATFRRKNDAVEWVRGQELKILGGRTSVRGAARLPTLQDAIDKYLSERHSDLNRRVHLSRWATALGAVPLKQLNYAAIKQAMTTLRAAPGRTTTGELSPSSIRVHLCSLSIVCKMAKRLGWIDHNPVEDVESFPQSKVRVRYLDEEELSRILNACRRSSYAPLYLIVLLALSTGMRKQEILSLKWKQVDWARKCLILEQTKNGLRRSVPLTGKALELLTEHNLAKRVPSDFVFPGD
jgi:integrase